MGRPRKHTNGSNDDILSFLSAARQKEVLDEALGGQARAIVEHHHGSTFGALVDALKKNPRWALLQKVSVSSVFRRAGRAAAAAPDGKGKRGRRGRRGKLDQALLDKVVSVIQRHPGKRSEELQHMIDGDRNRVKAALAKLREQKRVKTSGHKRATTYTAT